ncbi:IgGFc-binding protein-like [Hemicordylus capensis]|uniref:IgGFc-binding protein-like n=1 Tax=Hemicordylus capensis TaxID=884348 RepID=UPI002304070D|nr:IgGFc-binding protein-like [Hemicordylus capensis]
MHCEKGYICTLKHNMPQCVAEPKTCNIIQCQERTLCEVVHGEPTCVPSPPSCYHFQCPDGTVCVLTDSFPKCVPQSSSSSCAAIHCKEGTKCVITNGWPECIPVPASCENIKCNPGTVCNLANGVPNCVPIQPSCGEFQCKDGTVCEVVRGQPTCLQTPAPCGVILCEKGTICEIVDGHPTCVRVPPSCLHIECKQGTVCDMIDGWPKCIPGPTCDDLRCEAGTECKSVNGLPRCLPIPPSCREIHCGLGTVCELVNIKPTCVPIPSSCNKVQCHEGTICDIIDGWATCIPAVTSCDQILCPEETICEIVDQWPTCVPIPYSCEKIICEKGTVCDIVSGWPTCIPDSPTSCESLFCEEETVCTIVDGRPTCIPIPLSCEGFSCRQGSMCEIVNGWPTCVPLPPSCEKTECKQGTACEIVNGSPQCVPIPTTCEKLQCPEGNICEITSGGPSCVPVPASCENFYCKEGTICEITEGWPKCVPIPASCDNIHCGERAVCEMVDNWPRCVPIPTSCSKMHCQRGMICEMVNNWPTCIPVPASCNQITCKNGTVCEMIDHWPTCVPIPSSCDQIGCKEGTACQMIDGWPSCVPFSLSCDKVSCKVGTICEIIEGWPNCVPIPSCDNVQCKEHNVCEMLDGWPRCVPIPSTCDSIQCPMGTVCQILDAWPTCVSVPLSCGKLNCAEGTACQRVDNLPTCVPIQPSCEKVSCNIGTVCEIYEGQAKCIPISPSCDNFHCEEGTACEIINSWPQCLPLSPSCKNVSCDIGAVCQMVSGWPKCVHDLPSCDKFSCNEGTVCQVVYNLPTCVSTPFSCEQVGCNRGTVCVMFSGQPKCVPIPPSCDNLHCSEGTVCKVISGLPTCISIPSSCENTSCKEGTVCMMVDGSPSCIPTPPPDCASAFCEEGTVCGIYNGSLACLPISPSCESSHCTQGTVCEIIHGSPTCIPAYPSCHEIQCQEGTICEMINGGPICVPIPHSCEHTECQQGTVCEVINGWPHCVLGPPSPCASIICQEGTVCGIINGGPECVPSPPSCDTFHCNVGTICDILNGWPTCVPLPGSCESIHCQAGTVCRILNGWATCVAAAQSCHTTQCSSGTVCQIVDGSPRCVPVLAPQPICWASGQSHYHTFDGHSYDFQGTCTYTVAKTCRPHSGLPLFHIFTKSQRNGKTPFSFVSQVTVSVYGSNITMVKNEYGLVRVNQLRSHLPIILHDGKLSLYHRGGQLVIDTQFGLKVYYDWNYYLVVKVTPAFQGHLCGLCGNYNGDPNDDIVTSLGGLATDFVEFGRSWKVEDGDSACTHGCHGQCWRCSPELATRYSAETFCGLIIKHRGGPFHRCHPLVESKPYLDDCVTDLCSFEGYKQILCRALKTYADACQREGAVISDWRKHAGCPLSCPDNSQHMACGSACPATCSNLEAPKKCHLPCMETCQCNQGFVLDGGTCIPRDRCGCVYHGQLFAPNEQFWGDQQCHQHCSCRPHDRRVVCQASRCREGEECRVVNGIRNCYPTSYGICTAVSQVHYTTFDGLRYDFYGTCIYLLAELCHKRGNLTQFQVLVQNESVRPKDPSAAKIIEITVYGMTVIISRGKVLLNGLLINLPYNTEYYKISLYHQGWDIVVKTDFGFTVKFDGKNNIRVAVPGTYRNAMCGLCGNFNGQPNDDMLQSNNTITTSPGDFARSWKVRDIPGCTEVEKENCVDIINVERTQLQGMECGILLDTHGPFRMCHNQVPPQSYFKDCVFDYCSNKGNKNIICHIISSYAAACQTAGARVHEWRSTNFCRPTCPANSHYKVCASNCPVTCHSLFNPELCTTKCREGCECNEGFVLSGDQCVPISQCGCVHQGFYYKSGESFYPNGFCKEWCVCQVGGIMDCQRTSCGAHEECRVVKGVQKCHSLAPSRSGACHVAGDPHYLTFDGFTFDLQGNCTYSLVKSCTRKSSLPAFEVHVENERRARGKVSVTRTVSVTVYEHTVTMLREKRGIILVNGATSYLPFHLENHGMWVYYHGDNVVLRTDFGLLVSFDQLYHLVVMVPEIYQGQTCGLCGNYNGNPRDDIFLPTGHTAMSVQAFAAAWKVDIPMAVCTEDCAALVCGGCQESRKSSYVHNSLCGILQASYGPFSSCYSTINPTVFFNNCVHDLCKARGNPVILCRAIHSYVTACQAAGIEVKPWRSQRFCPMKCPINSHYELCTTACPSTCREATRITQCPNNCAEGCQCNKGYFMASYHCVPDSQCRCFLKGTWYKVGVRVITANCREQCTCHRQGRVVCTPLPCAAGESCVLSNGKWGCVPQEGHCSIAHRHIFTTYDRVSGKISTIGSYEISSLIDTKSPYWFRVVVKLCKCPTCPTPSVVAVTVYFHNLTVLVNQNSLVSVNGHPVHLPVQPSKDVSVTLIQEVVTVKLGSYVRVLFSPSGELTVVIHGKLANKVFKSCGNFNGNGADDLLLPNGRVAHTITEVISHWRVTATSQDAHTKIHSY